jgi:hypothetical protein
MDNIHRESETLPSVFAMDLKTPRLAPLRIWELSWTNCPIKRQHRPVIYLWLAWLNSSAPLMKIQASACVYKQQWQSRLRSQLQTAITFDGELSQIRGLACINLWQIIHPNNLEWSVSRGFPTFWHFPHVRISSILDHSYENLTLTTKKKKLDRHNAPTWSASAWSLWKSGQFFFWSTSIFLSIFGGSGTTKLEEPFGIWFF